MSAPTVFISYSHKDEDWKERLVSHLGVLQHEGLLDLWDDRRIGAGEDWNQEIKEAMTKASVAILLVSANFLTSNFILEEEVTRLMERHEKEGMRIFPIIAKPCAWNQVKWLSRMNLRPKDGEPLSGGNEHKIDTDLAAIANEVADIINRVPDNPSDKGYVPLPPEKISLAKLPSTSSIIFGRENELESLNAAWPDPNTNIISLVAWGGVGKTSLVNKWLRNMKADRFRGAERVFGWSFYSQGASEDKQVSADVFIASALDWFGDPEPDKGSPWDKGERLADFIKKQKTLLILDGLEPLQNPTGEDGGRIKDPGLQSMLRELANHNPGLCVITTRLEVDDVKDFIGNSVQSILLDHLSPDAGMKLLKHFDVKGTDEKLKQASREFGNHALALTLLGSYLTVVYEGDVRKRDLIESLTDEEEHGGHAKRVMESYEKWLKNKPELNILYIMGVFDRPAEVGAINAFMKKPAINGLTSDFKKLSFKNLKYTLNHLSKLGLLSNEVGKLDEVDCHPLMREYFGKKLKKNNPEVWKEGHSRLYDYYKNQTEEYPKTIEGMVPLYQAVAHGCEAGRHQDAFDEVYWHRIQRKEEVFNTKKLGAIGSELTVLSCLFDPPWSQPVSGLAVGYQSYILNQAGLCLQALCRLSDATQPMQSGLDAYIANEKWEYAAIAANNLSGLYLTLGNVTSALYYVRQSMEYADKSTNVFQWMGTRTTLANALHQMGRLEEAEASFVEVERRQKELQPEYSYLYSVQGFQYCDLLLGQGKYRYVLNRARQSIEIAKSNHWLLDIGLDHLSLGRAYLLQTRQERSNDFTQAETHLNQAMEGIRKAGRQDTLPLSLMARAKLYRMQSEFEKAQHDLDEAMTIAERGGMGLHMADCHLEYARLYLAKGEKEDARKNLETAKVMIGEMGYHRRDVDVVEIEDQLL